MTIQTLERKLKPYESKPKSPVLKWLYLHLPPQPITGKRMHHAYSTVVRILLKELELETVNHLIRGALERYLASVTPFIETFEKEQTPLKSVAPEKILSALIEQNGLSQYDLADDLGGQPVVSEILNGKRKLTREHIERLSKRFHISPASFYY